MQQSTTRKLCLLFLAGVMACAVTVLAGQQPTGGGEGAGSMMGQRHGPRDRVQRRLDRMSRVLNLTDDQKAKVKPLLEDESKQMRAIFRDNSLSREDRRSKFMALREQTEKEIQPVLTKDQLPKLKEAMAPEHQGMRGGHMMGQSHGGEPPAQ